MRLRSASHHIYDVRQSECINISRMAIIGKLMGSVMVGLQTTNVRCTAAAKRATQMALFISRTLGIGHSNCL